MTSWPREACHLAEALRRNAGERMAALDAGPGAVEGQPNPPNTIDEEEEGGEADRLHGDSPLADNEESLTRIGFHFLGEEPGGALRIAGQADTLFKRQLNGRRSSGVPRGTLQDF